MQRSKKKLILISETLIFFHLHFHSSSLPSLNNFKRAKSFNVTSMFKDYVLI